MSTEYGADQIQILEDWRPSEKDLECTLGAHLPEGYIILYTKL